MSLLPGADRITCWRGWPVSAARGRAVHLLPAGEFFGHGYPSTPVAVCGEPLISGPDDEDDPR
jgi:hypothetical protein